MDDKPSTILAIFPHPDDELGCIGTLANHSQRGDKVHMIWTTYGESTTMLPGMSTDEIKQERIRHANKISKIVEAEEVRFLDWGDTKIEVKRDLAVELAKIYCELKPDAIMTWDVFTNHPDHRNTAQIVIDAVTYARIAKVVEPLEPHREAVTVFHYHVEESPLPVIKIDISDTIDKVNEAVGFYAEIYGWTNWKRWIDNKRLKGTFNTSWYEEQFNVNLSSPRPPKYLFARCD